MQKYLHYCFFFLFFISIALFNPIVSYGDDYGLIDDTFYEDVKLENDIPEDLYRISNYPITIPDFKYSNKDVTSSVTQKDIGTENQTTIEFFIKSTKVAELTVISSKSVSFNRLAHTASPVSTGYTAQKNKSEDVRIKVYGSVLDISSVSYKFKNNKAVISGKKSPYFYLNLQPTGNKQEKRFVKALNSRLKKTPINFIINPKDLSDIAVITPTSKHKIKKITYTDGSKNIKLNKKDYKYTYSDNEYHVTFIGNYTGKYPKEIQKTDIPPKEDDEEIELPTPPDDPVIPPNPYEQVFDVSFVTGTSKTIPTQKIRYNNYARCPDTPVKTDGIFGGWYTDNFYTNKFLFNQPIIQNTILYARWLPPGLYKNDGTEVSWSGLINSGIVHIENGFLSSNYSNGINLSADALEGTLVLPNNLTGIYAYGFKGCNKLEYVYMPSGITRIEKEAFCDCSTLCDIRLPLSVTQIGNGAFMNCTSLIGFDMPSSIVEVPVNCFKGCSNLSYIYLSPYLTHIRGLAFYDCKKLSKGIVLPNSMSLIDGSAFAGCELLKTVSMPQVLSNMGGMVFNGCSSLTDINIPNNLTELPRSTFKNCTSLKNVIIPSSVQTIYNNAFDGSGVDNVVFEDITYKWKITGRDGLQAVNNSEINALMLTTTYSGVDWFREDLLNTSSITQKEDILNVDADGAYDIIDDLTDETLGDENIIDNNDIICYNITVVSDNNIEDTKTNLKGVSGNESNNWGIIQDKSPE